MRNIGIKEGMETNVMASIQVSDVYQQKFDQISAADNFNQVVNKVIRGKGVEFPVLNSEGNITGILSLNVIKDQMFEKDSLKDLLIAGDIANTNFETVSLSDNCKTALDRLRRHNYEGLPVVESDESRKIIGMIWQKDILDAYNKAIDRREITSSLASSITMKADEPKIHFIEGYSINEIRPPKSFIGKSIKQLNIRARFGIDVLSIKTKEKWGDKIKAIPSPDYIIQKNDRLVIAGEIKNINLLRNLE
jgi:predicted transcriptional regulator